MSIVSSFAGRYSALDYAYGIIGPSEGGPGGPSLQIGTGNGSTGASSIVLVSSITNTTGGNIQIPVSTNTPITIGIGSNAETVTPTAVSQGNLGSAGPGITSATISATFANLHGPQEPVTSGTFGLQEAINVANVNGGGVVVVTARWYSLGGTVAIIQAATLPTNGTVIIEDVSNGATSPIRWGTSPNSLTVVSAPSAATSSTVASQPGVTGTWTAITIHCLFTYVTADGGETLASSDYSFTATASVAIGGSGPAAATGAVGYKVYLGANATTTCYQAPVIAANGTVIQCGPVAAFKIGTPFSVATATTSAGNLIPVQSGAFPTGPQPIASPSMYQPFATVYPPFAVTGGVTAGTAVEIGRVNLPTGFLNYVNRTLRLKLIGYFTPVSTATLILSVLLESVYGTTTTTLFTVTTPATSGTAHSTFILDVVLQTASTGATGTIEAHGLLNYVGATATASAALSAVDNVIAVSAAADLTKQDVLSFQINSGTANLTQSQLRTTIVEVLL
jgi:hypothetical protein